nr:hypothetical protein [Allobaculum sp. Allo2]
MAVSIVVQRSCRRDDPVQPLIPGFGLKLTFLLIEGNSDAQAFGMLFQIAIVIAAAISDPVSIAEYE